MGLCASVTLETLASRFDELEQHLRTIEERIEHVENSVQDKVGSVGELVDEKLATLQNLLEKQAYYAQSERESHTQKVVQHVSKLIKKSESTLFAKGAQIVEKIHNIHSNLTSIGDCRETNRNGLYTLHLPSGLNVVVRCDKGFAGDGWMLIYKRLMSTMNFTQSWDSYREGFGNPFLDYWIGLENLHRITTADAYELNVNSYDFGRFEIDGEEEGYRITKVDYEPVHSLACILKQGTTFNTFDRSSLSADNRDYLLRKQFSFWGNNGTYDALRMRQVYDPQFSNGQIWIAIRRIV